MNSIEPDIGNLIEEGVLTFAVESRVLRELGERLVKSPEVALVELIKNAYDADACECVVHRHPTGAIVVTDDGTGMTHEQFLHGWMRIGTSAKQLSMVSRRFGRQITGEKGIGRFAVRFLGKLLYLETVAHDHKVGITTKLTAAFDWPRFDREEDLGNVQVPFKLFRVDDSVPTGTKLAIGNLRPAATKLNLNAIRTGSIGILTPLRPLFRVLPYDSDIGTVESGVDPGFMLKMQANSLKEEQDVASQILDAYVLRATLTVRDGKLDLCVFRRNSQEPHLRIVDSYPNDIGSLNSDIRFFPRRAGTFKNMPVDGRKAQSWITSNHGIAVFDRSFRVPPYGLRGDDWLNLQADAARNRRNPRSLLAEKHFAMTQPVRSDPGLNWMLRLPQSMQLVGVVQVVGKRSQLLATENDDEGLIASADRQGFVKNAAYGELYDLIRGAVEAIAFVDRQIQLEMAEEKRRRRIQNVREGTKSAIEEIQDNTDITARDKRRIVDALLETQEMMEEERESSQEREQQLQVMSLLGVVAGYMTHEFGAAMKEITDSHSELTRVQDRVPGIGDITTRLAVHISKLEDFVSYSTGYIRGSRTVPKDPYPVRPRLKQVRKYFGTYAAARDIVVDIDADPSLVAPRVPVSLYNGIALNLYTNALKAVAAKAGSTTGRIAFRAWNDKRWHHLEVCDTGIGIPSVLRERVFEPLFSTTGAGSGPLGSGMGLGLACVRRSVEAYGGRASVVDPPTGFATCLRVQLPLNV